ncbi:hypothetical protein OF83DRAFT_473119 [Amylostereum chailletii]|nr:hypothetical protein OF83DRAFT_473119 [Amylostereum chailletii]
MSTYFRMSLSHLRDDAVPFVLESDHGFAQLIETTCHVITLCATEAMDKSTGAIHALIREGERCAPALTLARESAQKHWYPAMRNLRSLDYSRKSAQDKRQYRFLVLSWRRFGGLLGLKESEERQRVEKELEDSRKDAQTFCGWKECAYHAQKPEGALRTCAGCDEVRYRDRNCQLKDWKAGHKKKCRRMKD